ncbi:MAG TPA: DUF6152 family protein [Bryobacteraceae bacterium]|nr:DUF6152 family protein [Bryobacteraceae bacterium]
MAHCSRWLILGLLAALSAFAERPFSSTYDDTRRVSLKGAVVRIDWVNPRAFLYIDVRDSSGETANWAVEFGNPIELERAGWKPGSLRIGDVVRIDGFPARGYRNQAFARSVVLASTRRRLFVVPPKTRVAAHLPAPRWPDGQVRLGPPPGKKGYWAPTANALVETGAGIIPMNRDGLLLNISDAARVAPFLPWAKAVYEYRQRTRLKDDPLARCIPAGGPRQFETPNGFQFVEQRELGRILVLLGGGDRNWRVIYTDGRPQGQADEVVRSYYGNSVGHWEEGSLVVDSIGFNERFWFDKGGLPHTEALHLIERFTRPDLNTLKYEVTVDDPRTYARPWKGGWTMEWVPGEEIQEYFCEENAESTFLR